MSDYDATDPDAIEEEAAFRAARDRYLKDAWDWLVRDARGRLVMADLMLATGMNAQTFVPGQADMTAFREGMRSIGNMLRDKIALNSSEFLPDIERQVRGLAQDVGDGGSKSG